MSASDCIRQARISLHDRAMRLLDTFGFGLNSEQSKRMAKARRTHAAFLEQRRPREHRARRIVGNYLSFAQNDNSISAAQFLRLVLDYNQAQALLAQLSDQLEHFRPTLRIEIRGRLVEHD